MTGTAIAPSSQTPAVTTAGGREVARYPAQSQMQTAQSDAAHLDPNTVDYHFDSPTEVDAAYQWIAHLWDTDGGLRRRWGTGTDAQANFKFARAFVASHPDVNEILVRSGFSDHPALIEAAAVLGRKYASEPGNPKTVVAKRESRPDVTKRAVVEQRINELQRAKHDALSRRDHSEANRLDQEQQALFVLLEETN